MKREKELYIAELEKELDDYNSSTRARLISYIMNKQYEAIIREFYDIRDDGTIWDLSWHIGETVDYMIWLYGGFDKGLREFEEFGEKFQESLVAKNTNKE